MPSPGRDDLDQFWGSGLDEAGIEWFLNNQCFFGVAGSDLMTDGVSYNTEAPNIYSVALEDEQPAKPQPVSLRRKPIFLQEAQSKPFIVETGKFKSPDCGFRVCNALTREKRSHLLAELQQLVHDVDINEHIFSLDSMKQGIHLFFRHINIEYTFIHHEFLMPSSEESREARLAVCGSDSEPGPLLFWAIISAGWSLMRSRNNHEHIMAAKIQRALRISMMSVGSNCICFPDEPADGLDLAPWPGLQSPAMACASFIRHLAICEIPGRPGRVRLRVHFSWRTPRGKKWSVTPVPALI